MSTTKLLSKVFLIFIFHRNCAQCFVQNDIRIRFYTGVTQFQLYTVKNLHTVINHQAFSINRDAVFYHYGFTQTENSDNVLDVIDASVTRGDRNFFLIYYLRPTTNTAFNALDIGRYLAYSYIKICEAGLPPSRLHLVGFSLGAQIQAIASRNVQTLTNSRLVVGRLTGLDPGQVHLTPRLGRLSPTDAAFVDTIHTESTGFGDIGSNGHASFFVNGGNSQPFCSGLISPVCSHNFSPTAWAESIRSQGPSFPSLQCSTWQDFVSGSCNNALIANMGMNLSRAANGRFFLRTNNAAPFSRPIVTS